MITTLADTSVWVDYLRRGTHSRGGATLQPLLDAGAILVCGPVVAELLAGASDQDHDQLAEVFSALGWAELERRDWLRVGELAAKLRRGGQTLPWTDVVIATAALSANARLLTADGDFERVARFEPGLQLELLGS